MENQLKKWIGLSYVTLAGLVVFVVSKLLERVVAAYDLETRINHIDVVIAAVAFSFGFIVLLYCFRSKKANQYTTEVATELFRVTWPTMPETQKATIVVIIMVLISGIFLGSLDILLTWLLKMVI